MVNNLAISCTLFLNILFGHKLLSSKENPLIINFKKSIFLLSALFQILDIARYNNGDQQELEIY